MNILKLVVAGWVAAIVAALTPVSYAQTVHAGADTDTRILIGQPGFQHEVIEDHHTGYIYTEANAHSWLPNPANWAAQAEAHAQRFHLDMPWPIPDIQWTNCWGRNQLRDGYNPKSAKNKASAWGSWYIIDGPPGEMAELRARIPAENLVDAPPEGVPSQGMYADSFFDVFTDVNTRVDLPGGGSVDLMTFSSTLAGPAAVTPGLTFTDGGWVESFFDVFATVSPSGEARELATIREDILSPLTVFLPTNTPFHVDWGLTIESEIMAEEELPPGMEISTAAAIAMQLELVDQSGLYNLRGIPEPATIVLATLGGLAMIHRRRAYRVTT
jgi:hypothetical protein